MTNIAKCFCFHMKPKLISFRNRCHVRNTTQRIKSLCIVKVDMVLLRTFAKYCRCGSYCGTVPVECRLSLAALQLKSVRKVTARKTRGQLGQQKLLLWFQFHHCIHDFYRRWQEPIISQIAVSTDSGTFKYSASTTCFFS